jgi:hypothetical protein
LDDHILKSGKRLGVLLVLTLALSLSGVVTLSASPIRGCNKTLLKREDVPAVVAERFKQLFGNLLIVNPIDGQAMAIEDLSAEDFTVTDEDAAMWTVRHDPLTGPMVQARVAKSCNLVEFDRIELAVE